MALDVAEKSFSSITNPLVNILLTIGASVLALMMFLTVVDVVGRYAFNKPIAGAFELVEFMMATFVPFAFVYCQKEKSHISVDLVVDRLPKGFQGFLDIVMTLLTIGFYGLIAWQSFYNITEEFESKMTSAVLLIPTYPFVIPASIAFVVLTLLLLLHFFQTLSTFLRK